MVWTRYGVRCFQKYQCHSANTQRNSQLFSPQVLRELWREVAVSVPSIFGRNHFHLPQDRAERKHLSWNLWVLVSWLFGREKVAFCEGNEACTPQGSHPNTKHLWWEITSRSPSGPHLPHTGAFFCHWHPSALILSCTNIRHDFLTGIFVVTQFLLFSLESLRV